MAEIIGIDADAVAADQAGAEGKEIPRVPAARYVERGYVDFGEDLRSRS
jgi:hypothetical protein